MNRIMMILILLLTGRCTAAQDTIFLSRIAGDSLYQAWQQASYYADGTQKLTLEEVMHQRFQQATDVRAFSRGNTQTKAVIWMKLNLWNDSGKEKNLVFVFGKGPFLSLYVVNREGIHF